MDKKCADKCPHSWKSGEIPVNSSIPSVISAKAAKTTESSDLGRAASRLELESETGICMDQQKAMSIRRHRTEKRKILKNNQDSYLSFPIFLCFPHTAVFYYKSPGQRQVNGQVYLQSVSFKQQL